MENFIPELWSRQLLKDFRRKLVFARLVNRNYEGEIKQYGDTVKITTPGKITVNNYAGTVNYETPDSTQQSLIIDKQRYAAFQIGDVIAAQANVDLMSTYMEETGIALAGDVDQDLAGLYTEAGDNSLSISLTTTSPREDLYPVLVDAGKILSKKDVPREGRWVVISEDAYAHVLKEPQFIHASVAGDEVLRTGAVGMIAGFQVHTSNNLVESSPNVRQYLYGTNAAITFAEQITRTEALRRESSFADAVRTLLVYGAKVVRPAALGTIAATEA